MGNSYDVKSSLPYHWLIDIFRFLLVSLNIESILQESTTYRRRERLSKMTEGLGLGEVYRGTIERIKAQGGDKSRLGMEALMWISHAERPLRANELCHALAIELGSMDFNAGNTPSITTLVSCCQGHITVDNEASTVRLIHFTLKEYLSAHPDIFSTPHSTMAEVCLTYLNSQQVKAIPLDDDPDLYDMPFLEYSSRYWGVHAKRELSAMSISLALQLLQDYDGHISIELLFRFEYCYLQDVETWYPFSGLHCASFFRIVDIVAALAGLGCCYMNGEDFLWHTPLAWAAQKGHEEVVKILLERGEVNTDQSDSASDRTPLSLAAGEGHETCVKILLGREEVNPDKPDNSGQTPLSYAAGNGKGEVVKMLLERGDVNPDKLDDMDRTPLSYATGGWCMDSGIVLKGIRGRVPNGPTGQVAGAGPGSSVLVDVND